MNSTEITLYFEEAKAAALKAVLAQEGSTIESKLQASLRFLYEQLVPVEQQSAIDEFINTGALPKRVDDFFVKAINALLKGFEPVVIDTDDFMAKLEQMPPMDEASFKAKITELIGAYTKGKDASKLRIVVKRKESEG